MKATARQIPTLLNATGEIAADEVDEEAGIPYSSLAQRGHSYHNDDAD
jgi:hypothetical protein